MKKVLALVLAVIMVCTMAFAVNVNINDDSKKYTEVVVTPGGAVAAIELDPSADLTKTYILKVPSEYFAVLTSVLGGKTPAEVLTVAGLSGNWASDGNYHVTVPVADKPLDGVADLTLAAFTIKKDAHNYAEVAVKNGKLKVVKVVIGSMDVTKDTDVAALVKAVNDGKALDASYDVGMTTTPLDTTTPSVGNNGWYVNTQNKVVKIVLESGKVVITVPAKATFKFEKKEITLPVVPGVTFSPIITNGYKVTGATLDYAIKAAQGSNDIYYAADVAGNVYAAGLTFTIVKDALGNESGYWVQKTTDYVYGIYTADKVLSVNTLPGTTSSTGSTGSTTNPGTGANDVVGVAAALAVVALVSGAAISLKK